METTESRQTCLQRGFKKANRKQALDGIVHLDHVVEGLARVEPHIVVRVLKLNHDRTEQRINEEAGHLKRRNFE